MAHKLPFKVEKLPYKRPIPQIPHPSVVEEFISEISDPMKQAMTRLMQLAGLRFKEVRLLRWEKLDWRKKTGMLIDTKGGTPRYFIIPEQVWDILYPMKQPGGYVFLNHRTGNPYTSMKTLFKAASRRANTGQRINPHLLRHQSPRCHRRPETCPGDRRIQGYQNNDDLHPNIHRPASGRTQENH